MAKRGMPEGIQTTIGWVLGVGIIALIALIMVILFGNLSGNVGFASGTQGYNDTQNIILNYTTSATSVSSQFPTLGVIIGVALLLVILVGVLIYMVKKLSSATSMGSNASFG